MIKTFDLGGGARLTCYIYENENNGAFRRLAPAPLRPGVMICPGGAYVFCNVLSEGHPVAALMMSKGFNAFVLEYSVGAEAVFPIPLCQLSRAFKFVREHHMELGTDPDKLAVMGFSAGGHLAASLGTMWNDPEYQALAGVSGEENRPDALILIYPCIVADIAGHRGMYSLLAGDAPLESVREKCSCELHVGPHTPPAFIVHSYEDNLVPVDHSLLFARAMADADRPFELHILEKGRHGDANILMSAPDDSSPLMRASERCYAALFDWLFQRFGPLPSSAPPPDDGVPLPDFSPRRTHLGESTI